MAPCGACGRVGPVAVKATGTSPALGRCCYEPPTAICRARRSPCWKTFAGRVAVSHAALNVAQGDDHDGRAVGHVRAALVQCGVLEPRDEPSASFARWQQRAVDAIAPGPDRGHVRAYASWHVAHQLARTSARGRATPATQKYARSLVAEAIKLVRWLHEQELELRDLRQDLIDAWIATGATTRRCVRLFLRWLARAGVTGELHVAWNTHRAGHGPLAEQQRFAVARRLLHDRDIDPRDRFAGLLLLLYAQPLTRTAALRTSDIRVTHDGEVTITLAGGRRRAARAARLARSCAALPAPQRRRRRVAAVRRQGRHPHHRRAAPRTPPALRDHQPPQPPRGAARPRRATAGTDPRRAPRPAPRTRRAMGPRRRRHLRRLRRPQGPRSRRCAPVSGDR